MNSFDVRHADGKNAVVTLSRNVIGGADALDFSTQLSALITSGVRRIIVDLAEVELINSSGLGMLVQGLSLMRKSGGIVVLASVPERVQKHLEMTRLSSVCTIFSSVEAALAGN